MQSFNYKECSIRNPFIIEHGFKTLRKSPYLYIIDYKKVNISKFPLHEGRKEYLKIIPEKALQPFYVNKYLMLKFEFKYYYTLRISFYITIYLYIKNAE